MKSRRTTDGDSPEAFGRSDAPRLAHALGATTAAILVIGEEATVEHANPACERLFDCGPGELVDLPLATLLDIGHRQDIAVDLASAFARNGAWAAEIGILRTDDTVRPCAVSLAPLLSEEVCTGYVATIRDLSGHVAREEELRAENASLAEQAARDSLTGLYNRGYLRDVSHRESARSKRHGTPLAVLMIDLDGYKQVNDTRGHGVGDLALVDLARTLLQGVRQDDVAARYGGDEFCVLLPDTDMDAARAVAERLRHLVQAARYGGDEDIRLTVSIGVAASPDLAGGGLAGGGPVDALELIRHADAKMLEAKRRGGNRVHAWA